MTPNSCEHDWRSETRNHASSEKAMKEKWTGETARGTHAQRLPPPGGRVPVMDVLEPMIPLMHARPYRNRCPISSCPKHTPVSPSVFRDLPWHSIWALSRTKTRGNSGQIIPIAHKHKLHSLEGWVIFRQRSFSLWSPSCRARKTMYRTRIKGVWVMGRCGCVVGGWVGGGGERYWKQKSDALVRQIASGRYTQRKTTHVNVTC